MNEKLCYEHFLSEKTLFQKNIPILQHERTNVTIHFASCLLASYCEFILQVVTVLSCVLTSLRGFKNQGVFFHDLTSIFARIAWLDHSIFSTLLFHTSYHPPFQQIFNTLQYQILLGSRIEKRPSWIILKQLTMTVSSVQLLNETLIFGWSGCTLQCRCVLIKSIHDSCNRQLITKKPPINYWRAYRPHRYKSQTATQKLILKAILL